LSDDSEEMMYNNHILPKDLENSIEIFVPKITENCCQVSNKAQRLIHPSSEFTIIRYSVRGKLPAVPIVGSSKADEINFSCHSQIIYNHN
jgi:hypothetical protein